MIPNHYMKDGWKSSNIHLKKRLFRVPNKDFLSMLISSHQDPQTVLRGLWHRLCFIPAEAGQGTQWHNNTYNCNARHTWILQIKIDYKPPGTQMTLVLAGV